jgi:hypothetical protein
MDERRSSGSCATSSSSDLLDRAPRALTSRRRCQGRGALGLDSLDFIEQPIALEERPGVIQEGEDVRRTSARSAPVRFIAARAGA